jgi:hypothetical protein
MSLIEVMTKLREMEAKAKGESNLGMMDNTAKFEEIAPKVLPAILAILEEVRAGDAKRLADLLRWQMINDECSEDEIDMLDRLHEMCCKMEAKGK